MRKLLLYTTIAFCVHGGANAGELSSLDDIVELCRWSTAPADLEGTPGVDSQDASFASWGPDAQRDPGAEGALQQMEQVQEYARRRSAIVSESHRLEVAAHDVTLMPYDDELGALTVDLGGGVGLFGGSARLHTGHLSRAEFALDADAAESLQSMLALGTVSVHVDVELVAAEDPSRGFCSLGRDGTIEVHAHLLSAVFVARDGEEVAESRSRRAVEHSVRCGYAHLREEQGLQPEVRVTGMDFIGVESLGPAEARLLAVTAEARLADCYLRALRDNGMARGAIVFELQLGSDGRVESTESSLDVVRSTLLQECAVDTLNRVDIRDADAAGPAGRVRMTVFFDLADSE